ncbi:MAG: tRNA (adenosine(37)-N6)-dimethylallyltransferase MiaA [Armatimonadota bacterium]
MKNAGQCDNLIVIVGPTAVGKTAVAIELACKIGGEIISADSMAVYVGMDVGTAKPTREEQSRARFHLIDVVDPSEDFNVGEFQRLAHQAIDDVLERNPPAILVGGSGLYVRAAVDGLDLDIPAGSEELRKDLRDQAHKYGNEYLHRRLRELDPVSAAQIHPNNLKRVIRAIEICELSGSPASELHDKTRSGYNCARFFGLTMNRQLLYERIEKRVDAMIADGLIDEVSGLLNRGIEPQMLSMQGVGYKEIAGFLRGEYTKQEAIQLLKRNTRRFAKRQYTWFMRDERIRWLEIDGMTAKKVSELIIKE